MGKVRILSFGVSVDGYGAGPSQDLDNPPFHTDVFVLTHYARPPIEMEGGMTFTFVTDGIQSALRKAIESANGRDVRIGGGVETVRQYLKASLVDEMHLAIAPALLGNGVNLSYPAWT